MKKRIIIFNVAIFILLIFCIIVTIAQEHDDYVIVGNRVQYENNLGKIVVWDHTSNNIITQVQFVNITWKGNPTELDFAFKLTPSNNHNWRNKKVYIWKNISHPNEKPIYGNVTETLNCAGIQGENYGLINESMAWCNDSICLQNANDTTDCYFEHAFDYYKKNDIGARLFWNETKVIGMTDKWYYDYKNVNDLLSSTVYNGNYYYFIKNVNFDSDETKQIKIEYDTPINSRGKWTLFVKRSSDSISEALSSNHYIKLDPWWNSNWGKRKEINITENSGETVYNYSLTIKVDYDDDMNQTFTDLRFVDSTNTEELFYYIENKVDGNHSNVTVKIPELTASSVTKIYMYYDNPEVDSASNKTNAYLLYDDFVSFDTNKWERGKNNAANDFDVSAGSLGVDTTTSGGQWWKGNVWVHSKNSIGNMNDKYQIDLNIYVEDTPSADFLGYVGLYQSSSVALVGGITTYGWGHTAVRDTIGNWETANDMLNGNTANYNNSNYPGVNDWANWTIYLNSTSLNHTVGSYWINISHTYSGSAYIDIGGVARDSDRIHMDIDWIKVRRYALSKPTYTIGDEACGFASINITYPINNSKLTYNESVNINYTYADAQTCGWSLDYGSTNTSISCGTNITTDLPNGENFVIVWANTSLNSVAIDSVNISIDSVIPTINITSPIGTYSSTNIKLNVSVNEIHPQACIYNVTFGSSTEISNTVLDCSSGLNISNFTVSSTGTTYSFNIWFNDTYGNFNTSSSTFIVSTGGGAAPGGGATGGPAVVVISKNLSWSIASDSDTSGYTFIMDKNRNVRESVIKLTNLDTKEVYLKLSCEDIDGDLCQYVSIKNTTITLPPTELKPVYIDFTIVLPQDIVERAYNFNIVAVDQNNAKGKLSIKVMYGIEGFLAWLLKLTETRTVKGIKIPVALIAFFVTFGLFMSSFMLLRKIDIAIRGSVSLVIAAVGLIIILAFI